MERFEVRTFDELLAVRDQWRTLGDRAGVFTPFQSAGWLIPWWRHFGGSTLRVIAFREDGRLVGLAPLFIYTREDGARVLCLLGSGISDYLDIIAESGFETRCAAGTYRWIEEQEALWDECDLQELRPDASLLKAPVPGRLHHEVSVMSVCMQLDLPERPDQLLERFPKKFRRNVRHALTRLDHDGRAGLLTADPGRLREYMGDLYRLHDQRWHSRSMPGVLSTSSLRAFYDEVAQALTQDGMLLLYRLVFNEKPIASYFVLHHRGTAYAYIGGFDPESEQYSPGTVALFLVVGDAIERNMRTFDFLRGAENYKCQWNASERVNVRIRITHGRNKGS